MRILIATIVVFGSLQASSHDLLKYNDAGDIDVIETTGEGEFVCRVEDRWSDFPVAARGAGIKIAAKRAKAACMDRQKRTKKEVSAEDCVVLGCEKDPTGSVTTKSQFKILRKDNVAAADSGQGPWLCTVDNSNHDQIFTARASTKTESMVAAQILCLENLGFDGEGAMFCDPRPNDCSDERNKVDPELLKLKARTAALFWDFAEQAAQYLADKLDLFGDKKREAAAKEAFENKN